LGNVVEEHAWMEKGSEMPAVVFHGTADKTIP
jgi:hypothetical protein